MNLNVYTNMQKLSSILLFYKPYFLLSFAINILITIFNPEIITAIGTKLIFVVFLWYFISQTKGKRMFDSYKIIGFSTFKLFTSIFLIDIALTIGYLLIIKEFI